MTRASKAKPEKPARPRKPKPAPYPGVKYRLNDRGEFEETK